MAIVDTARTHADLTADITDYLTQHPSRDHTAHHIWASITHRHPLRTVAACLDTLYRNGRITRRKTKHARLYRYDPTPA